MLLDLLFLNLQYVHVIITEFFYAVIVVFGLQINICLQIKKNVIQSPGLVVMGDD